MCLVGLRFFSDLTCPRLQARGEVTSLYMSFWNIFKLLVLCDVNVLVISDSSCQMLRERYRCWKENKAATSRLWPGKTAKQPRLFSSSILGADTWQRWTTCFLLNIIIFRMEGGTLDCELPGIRQKPIIMYISNEDTQNYPLCRLQLVAKTFGHST